MKGLYAHFSEIEKLSNLAEKNIEELKKTIQKSQKDLKFWENLLDLSQICAKLAGQEATKEKKGQLHYKWTKVNIQGSKDWFSEAGDVTLKAWGKYEGFPKSLEHLRPFADDDRSANHMAHRPPKDHFDSDTTDFDTLIDCQLAVEKAHDDWKKEQEKRRKK